MAISDMTTVHPVARPKGELSVTEHQRMLRAMVKRKAAEDAYRAAVVRAVEKSSFRAVYELTGHSTDTLQRWKREADK